MAKSYEASGKNVDEAIDLACALAGTTIENVEIEILELGGKGLFGLGHKDARVRVTVEESAVKEEEKKAPQSTFGKKKSKKEAKPQKPAVMDIEIAPIVVIDPGTTPPPENLSRKNNAQRNTAAGEHTERNRDNHETRRESHATMISEGEMADEIFAIAESFLKPIFASMGVEPAYNKEIKDGILWIVLSGEKLGLLIGRRGETLNALQYLTNLAVNKRRGDRVRIVLNVEGYRESREQTLHALAKKMAEKAVKTGRRVELEPMNPHERRIVHIALQSDKRVETTSHGEEPYRRVVVFAKRRRNNNRRSDNRQRTESAALPNVIIQHDTDGE